MSLKTKSSEKYFLFLGLLGVLCILVFYSELADAKVYRWIDDSGKAHITDDISKVPKKYRKKLRVPANVSQKSGTGSVKSKHTGKFVKKKVGPLQVSLKHKTFIISPDVYKISWWLIIKNNKSALKSSRAKISFLDASGNSLHSISKFDLRAGGKSTKHYKGYEIVKASLGKNIVGSNFQIEITEPRDRDKAILEAEKHISFKNIVLNAKNLTANWSVDAVNKSKKALRFDLLLYFDDPNDFRIWHFFEMDLYIKGKGKESFAGKTHLPREIFEAVKNKRNLGIKIYSVGFR
jgi:hypothetical protein